MVSRFVLARAAGAARPPTPAGLMTASSAGAPESRGALGRGALGARRRAFGGSGSAFGLGRDRLGLVLGLAHGGLFVATRELATAGEVLVEVVRTDEVLDVEERGALLPDVDEGGLKARENARDLPQVDVADSARLAAFSFDVELGDDAVFDQRGARLAEITAQYEDVLGHWRESLSRPRRVRASLRLSNRWKNGRALHPPHAQWA